MHTDAPRRWLGRLFRQPPPELYRQTSLYLSGDTLEIEGYGRILCYDDALLRLELAGGCFTVRGDGLRIAALTTRRLTLQGRILQAGFSDL